MSFFRCENQPQITEIPRRYANRAAARIHNFLALTSREQAQIYLGTAMIVTGTIGIVTGLADSLAYPGNQRDIFLIVGGILLAVAGGLVYVIECGPRPPEAPQQQNVPMDIQQPQNPPIMQEEAEEPDNNYQRLD